MIPRIEVVLHDRELALRHRLHAAEGSPRPGREGQHKLLTSTPRGDNNNVRIKIDGNDFRFGYVSKGTAEFVREKDQKTRKFFEWKEHKVRSGMLTRYGDEDGVQGVQDHRHAGGVHRRR